MVKYHQKSIAVPHTWPIQRKKTTFVVKPLPSGHPKLYSMPIALFMKDLIKCAHTQKEVKYILHNKELLINGHRVRNEKVCAGLMDVIELPELKKQYRVILNPLGKITVIEVSDKEKNLKPSKVIGKTSLNKDICQLNLMDGRNMQVSHKDAALYKVGDSILIDFKANKIQEHLPYEKGCTLFIIGGKSSGKVVTLTEVQGDVILFKTKEGTFETAKRYGFVVGKGKPSINLEAKE